MAGLMIKPELLRYEQFFNTGWGLLFLKFSRDYESQADHPGLRYMVREGNYPRLMVPLFDMLTRGSYRLAELGLGPRSSRNIHFNTTADRDRTTQVI